MTCQFVYQIVFLVTVTMYAWNIHIEGNYKYCCSLRCIKQNEEILELLDVSQLFVIIGSEIEHKVRGFRTTTPPGNSLHCYYIDGVAWYGNHELRIIVLDLRLDNLQHSRPKVSLLLFRTQEKIALWRKIH